MVFAGEILPGSNKAGMLKLMDARWPLRKLVD
jgi:hypothetical protein